MLFFIIYVEPFVNGFPLIRNDAMEDRYSVLVKFDDQKSADTFYHELTGWRFLSAEVCFNYIYYWVILSLFISYFPHPAEFDYAFGWLELQGEVCHILFVNSIEYTESMEIASTPAKSIELPTCPVCLGKIVFPFLFYFKVVSFMVDFEVLMHNLIWCRFEFLMS